MQTGVTQLSVIEETKNRIIPLQWKMKIRLEKKRATEASSVTNTCSMPQDPSYRQYSLSHSSLTLVCQLSLGTRPYWSTCMIFLVFGFLFATENKEGHSKWSLHDTWRLPGQIGVNKNQLNNWQFLGTGPKGWWWSRQRKRLEVFQLRQSVLRRGTLRQRNDGRETPRWGTTSLGLTAKTKHALL